MGQWSMHIEGHGVHDNGRPDDADTMLKQFVEQLRQHQQVSAATFTVGSTRSVRDDGSLREAQAHTDAQATRSDLNRPLLGQSLGENPEIAEQANTYTRDHGYTGDVYGTEPTPARDVNQGGAMGAMHGGYPDAAPRHAAPETTEATPDASVSSGYVIPVPEKTYHSER